MIVIVFEALFRLVCRLRRFNEMTTFLHPVEETRWWMTFAQFPHAAIINLYTVEIYIANTTPKSRSG